MVAAYAVVFFRSVSAGLLATDSAKYALNLAVPHPPLGRWLMLASQWIFGTTVFGLRFPSFLADIGSCLVFLAIGFRREKFYGWWLALYAVMACNMGVLFWSGQGYQTSFLACAIALMAYGTTKEGVGRFVWIAAGYLLAIWTQLQGLLLFPAVAILFWEAWRHKRMELRARDPVFIVGLLLLIHTGLVLLWFVTNPFAIADAMGLAHRASAITQGHIWDLLRIDFVRLLIGGIGIGIIALCLNTERRFFSAALMASLVIFSLYLLKNPALYYTPYVFALAAWSLTEVSLHRKWERCVVAGIAVGIVLIDTPALWHHMKEITPRLNRENMAQLRTFMTEYPQSMALGNFGYEWNFFLQQRPIRFTRNSVIQEKTDAVFVFMPETLSEEERAYMAKFPHFVRLGTAEVYLR